MLPIVSAVLCLYLMTNLAVETWIFFAIWLVIGIAIYFAYGQRHSRLNEKFAEARASVNGPGTASAVSAAGAAPRRTTRTRSPAPEPGAIGPATSKSPEPCEFAGNFRRSSHGSGDFGVGRRSVGGAP